VCRDVSEELCQALARLVPQLTSSATIPSENDVREILNADGTYLLVARYGDSIVGTLTLVMFRIPTGVDGPALAVSVYPPKAGRASASGRHRLEDQDVLTWQDVGLPRENEAFSLELLSRLLDAHLVLEANRN